AGGFDLFNDFTFYRCVVFIHPSVKGKKVDYSPNAETTKGQGHEESLSVMAKVVAMAADDAHGDPKQPGNEPGPLSLFILEQENVQFVGSQVSFGCDEGIHVTFLSK